MTNKRIPQLDALTGAASANDDSIVIFDASTDTTKRILRSQLAIGLAGDIPFTPAGIVSSTTLVNAVTEIATDVGTMALQDADNVAITGGTISGVSFNTPFTIPGTASSTGEIRLAEDTDNGTNYVGLKAPASISADISWTLPATDGVSGQFLSTNGSGTLSWSSPAGGGDVSGPASSTDNAIVRFDSTSGKAIQNSGVTIADDNATVISGSSTADMLRITQTGTGNALLIEDETNPDATPFQVNASGQVSIGTTTASGRLNIYDASAAQVFVSGDAATVFNLTRYSSDVSQANVVQRKARGTLASPTAVNSGDGVGLFAFNAYGGTNFRQVGTLQAVVETYTSDTNISGYLAFSTNSGGTSVTERMRINAAGQILSSDGAVGTPAYSAISDTNTGIFFPAADTIAFAEGGTEAMRINSDAQVVTTAGTAALPAITTTGDTNTGIFFPAADTVAISAAGTEDFRIGPAGQLGIGGANYGTSGQVLTSGGSGAAPSWAAAPTPAALSTASGSAPSYSARAWVNFNGTGTIAIRASGNVSSITDHAGGDYSINFTTAMPDANYAVLGTSGQNAAASGMNIVGRNLDTSVQTTTAVRLYNLNTSASAIDNPNMNIAIFR